VCILVSTVVGVEPGGRSQVSERLLQRFHEQATQALSWKQGRDATAVLEALGSALFLHVAGELHRTDSVTRKRLASIASQVLLAKAHVASSRSDGEEGDQDEDDLAAAQAAVTRMSRAGLAALSGKALELEGGTRIHPATLTFARMFHGEADGLTSGRYAMHIARCEECQARLDALRFVESTERSSEEWSVAAAASAQVRDPSTGSKVGTLATPSLEAVLFPDRRLAVYADSNDPLRVVAEGVTTEQTLGGYWLGRIPEGMTAIEATVHFAGVEHRWRIALGPRK
jgi:hypothetical protein